MSSRVFFDEYKYAQFILDYIFLHFYFPKLTITVTNTYCIKYVFKKKKCISAFLSEIHYHGHEYINMKYILDYIIFLSK